MELNKTKGLKSTFSTLKSLRFITFMVVLIVSASCTISYKFTGGNIDYTKTKSISIVDFINTSELVYAPLSLEFSEKLRDAYRKTTRLQLLKKSGDLHLEGEIVGYELTPMAISADTYASQTKLTITINVRFTNNKNPEDDFEKKYTAYQTFDSDRMLSDIQDELHKSMIDEIVDNIYNDTVAKW